MLPFSSSNLGMCAETQRQTFFMQHYDPKSTCRVYLVVNSPYIRKVQQPFAEYILQGFYANPGFILRSARRLTVHIN